ncbi:MAG: PKD domain-containing protein [Gemmatimonadota bacterium]|nr:PKD domain-containing protein [Gemmatimonadota bacterium]
MKSRWIVLGSLFSLVALAVACEDNSQIGSPLTVSLTGPETGRTGEDLPFVYDVAGRSLSGIIFEWGDGTRDSLATAGAQTAVGTRTHAYDSVGVYLVNLVAEDAVEGVEAAQVSVDVQANQ